MQQWAKFALHHRISIREARLTSGCNELIEFNKMEEMRLKQHDKIDYYFANLTLAVASIFSTDNLKLQDFLIDFSMPEPISEAEKMKNSIAAWEAVTGKKATFKD